MPGIQTSATSEQARAQAFVELGFDTTQALMLAVTRDEGEHVELEHVRRLLRDTLGSVADEPDLATTLFLTLRGFSLSQQLLETMGYDSPPPPTHRVARQRRLLIQALAAYIEELAEDEL